MRTGRPWAGVLAWVVTAAVLVVAFATGTAAAPAQVGIAIAVGVVPLALGTLVCRRRPGHAAGPLLCGSGVVAIAANSLGDNTPAVLAGTWMLLYLPLALLLLVMPDGHAASPRWRAVGWALTAVVTLFIADCAVEAIVPGASAVTQAIGIPLLLAFLGLLIACAVAPIARYRRSKEDDRLRLRWVFVVGSTVPITLLLCWASYLLVGSADLVGVGLVLMFVLIPAGATVALLRPTMFDIDRAAVATATATVLAVLVLAILSAASAIVGAALVTWSPVAAWAATATLTLAAIAAYAPLKRRFDRLLYPERGRTLAGVRDLVARCDRGQAQPEDLEAVLRAGLRDPDAHIAYRRIGDDAVVDLLGRPVRPGAIVSPVRVRGEEIGAIVTGPGRAKPPAATVITASAPLVDAIRARAELGRTMAELDASRARLVRTGYEERRRLERDLHDGAQQRLVALGMRLRVLQRERSGTHDPALRDGLDDAVAELSTAVAELRRIAQGVRPSALDDGLGPALADLVRTCPQAIELDLDDVTLPDAVATTAYFVVSEAVTNALRHAGAGRIRVTVAPRVAASGSATVAVRIEDDGVGGAFARPTGGLTGLNDRVEALGGRLKVHSPAGGGTTVEAFLPCGS